MRIYLLKQIKHKPSYLKVFKMIKYTHSIQIQTLTVCMYGMWDHVYWKKTDKDK